MPSKNLTLGLGLLLAGVALAHHQTYGTTQGDTSARVGEKAAVSTASLNIQNPLVPNEGNESGRSSVIFGATLVSDPKVKASVPSGTGEKSAKKAQPGAKHTGAVHVVRSGENDWIIAHHAGLTTVALKNLNPGVNLSKLHIGQKLNVPGSVASTSSNSASATKVAAKKIRSRYAVVAADSVTIRRDASRNAEAITQVDAGTRVVVLDRDGDWYRLRFPRGTEGWVRGDFLKAASAPKVERRHESHASYVASRPAKRSRVAQRSTTRYHRGSSAFVSNSGGKDASQILAQARSMSGVRYRWGAMSRSATDCSGFTSQVFRSQGYKIPRTSSEQSTTGIPVHSKDLKPGDLVFFHTRRGARVTHVGIYMGKGKFIHASSGGGQVQVNSLADGYYKQRLVAARRVAKSSSTKKAAPKKTVVAAKEPTVKKVDAVEPTTQPAISVEPSPDGK